MLKLEVDFRVGESVWFWRCGKAVRSRVKRIRIHGYKTSDKIYRVEYSVDIDYKDLGSPKYDALGNIFYSSKNLAPSLLFHSKEACESAYQSKQFNQNK